MDINDAIDVAAGDPVDLISSDLTRFDRASRRVARARGTIRRFLQAVPEDYTVFELRELLERRI